MEPSAPTAAACSRHADRAAVITCARCGDYLCHDCVDPVARTVCSDCAARGGAVDFPFDRERFSFGGLFELAFERFKLGWLPLMGAVVLPYLGSLVIALPVVGVTMLRGPEAMQEPLFKWVINPVAGLAAGIVANVLLFAFLSLAAEVVWHGVATTAAWSRGASRIGAATLWAFASSAVSYVFQAAFALFGLEPTPEMYANPQLLFGKLAWLIPIGLVWAVVGSYVWLGLMFAQTELAIRPNVGVVAAVVRSWRMARGFRAWLLLAWIAVIPIVFAGWMCCCLPVIPAAAFCGTFLTAIYFAIAPRDLAFPRA